MSPHWRNVLSAVAVFSPVFDIKLLFYSYLASFDCPEGYVKCHRSFCLEKRFVCDGVQQCPNGEDEQKCGKFFLTHICLASHFWDIGKQCRPRSDAAERGI